MIVVDTVHSNPDGSIQSQDDPLANTYEKIQDAVLQSICLLLDTNWTILLVEAIFVLHLLFIFHIAKYYILIFN